MDKSNSSNPSNGHNNGHRVNGYNLIELLTQRSNTMRSSGLEIDFRQIFAKVRHYKKEILFIVVVSAILSGIVAFSLPPIYRSQGSILITESKSQNPPSGSSGVSTIISNMYGIGLGNTIANELQILRSRTLAMELADKLMQERTMSNGQQYPVLWRKYEKDPALASQDTVAERIRGNIKFKQVDEKSDLVQITYESISPLEAARVVNLAMNTYTELSTRQNRKTAQAAVQFLQEEKKRIGKDLRASEQQLRDFMNEKKLIQLDSQTEELIRHIAELENNLQSVRVQQVAVMSAIEQYRNRINSIKPGLAEQYAEAIGPKMNRFQYQLAELETEKMLLISRNPGLENSPNPPHELRVLNDKITLLQKRVKELTEELIKQNDQYMGIIGGREGNVAQNIADIQGKLIELTAEQNQYKAQEAVLEERLKQERAIFDYLPANMMDLARLKRDVEINEQLFRTVSQQHAEMSLWEQTRFGPGRPVDYGFIPEKPVGPVKKLYLIVGIFFGMLVSIGYVGFQELVNTKIDSLEKLRSFDYPVLAAIPDIDQYIKKHRKGKLAIAVLGDKISTRLVTILDSLSQETEAFRRLKNNVIYSRSGVKTLMVTSYRKGEGKTTITGNLGVVLAESGKSVIIIDTDLRNPDMHAMFGLQRSPGIVEVLFDGDNLKNVIQRTAVSGLDILSAGRISSNPVIANQNARFHGLIEELKARYDYVLIDTAPFGILTDAANLIEKVDGTILVARFENTREDELAQTINNLRQVNGNILGTVMSAYDYDRSKDYYGKTYPTAYKEYFSDQESIN